MENMGPPFAYATHWRCGYGVWQPVVCIAGCGRRHIYGAHSGAFSPHGVELWPSQHCHDAALSVDYIFLESKVHLSGYDLLYFLPWTNRRFLRRFIWPDRADRTAAAVDHCVGGAQLYHCIHWRWDLRAIQSGRLLQRFDPGDFCTSNSQRSSSGGRVCCGTLYLSYAGFCWGAPSALARSSP